MATILVDIDGVCVDLHEAWLDRYNKDYNDTLTSVRVLGWGIHDYVKPECGMKIYDYLRDDSLYDDAPEIDGAKTNLRCIETMGHKIVYVSAGFYTAKIRWLVEHGFPVTFPYPQDRRWETVSNVILAGDKSLIRGDVMIDDRPENLYGFDGKRVLLNQPWNWRFTPEEQHNKYITRVNTWSEFYHFVGTNIGYIPTYEPKTDIRLNK